MAIIMTEHVFFIQTSTFSYTKKKVKANVLTNFKITNLTKRSIINTFKLLTNYETCGIFPTSTFSFSKIKIEVNVIEIQNSIQTLYTLTTNPQFDN